MRTSEELGRGVFHSVRHVHHAAQEPLVVVCEPTSMFGANPETRNPKSLPETRNAELDTLEARNGSMLKVGTAETETAEIC